VCVVECFHREKINILKIQTHEYIIEFFNSDHTQHIVLFLYYQTKISKLRDAISSSLLIVNKSYTSKLKSEWLSCSMLSLFSRECKNDITEL